MRFIDDQAPRGELSAPLGQLRAYLDWLESVSVPSVQGTSTGPRSPRPQLTLIRGGAGDG